MRWWEAPRTEVQEALQEELLRGRWLAGWWLPAGVVTDDEVWRLLRLLPAGWIQPVHAADADVPDGRFPGAIVVGPPLGDAVRVDAQASLGVTSVQRELAQLRESVEEVRPRIDVPEVARRLDGPPRTWLSWRGWLELFVGVRLPHAEVEAAEPALRHVPGLREHPVGDHATAILGVRLGAVTGKGGVAEVDLGSWRAGADALVAAGARYWLCERSSYHH